MNLLFFFPSESPNADYSCGDAVVGNPLRYFQERGFKIHCILPNTPKNEGAVADLKQLFPAVTKITRLPDLGPFPARGRSILNFASAQATACIRKELKVVPDLIFANGVALTPLIADLKIPAKKILAAARFEADSSAVADDRQNSDGICKINPHVIDAKRRYLRKMELDLFRLYNRLIFSNAADLETAQMLGCNGASYVPPTLPIDCPPVAVAEDFDILYVGDNSEDNNRDIEWFYRSVYVPFLRSKGTRLTVVGSVCRSFDYPDAKVERHPTISSLPGEIYARAKVVIHPQLASYARSIAIIEALGYGCPIATTPAAVRGFPPSQDVYLAIDMKADPAGTAREIADLLESPERRDRLRERSRSYFATHFSREKYAAAMDGVVASLRVAS